MNNSRVLGVSGGTASLSGTIANNVNGADKFIVSASFDYLQTGGIAAKDLKCGGGC